MSPREVMAKLVDNAYTLLEKMASNDYQWAMDPSAPRQVAEIFENDLIARLSKKWGFRQLSISLIYTVFLDESVLNALLPSACSTLCSYSLSTK